ncbi:MAG TPA: ubiquinone biosynthesis regulatory protein kinase UbiB [Gammaproteobacteria bacterium]|nr:ubiquinone biosynthesis regulatory protein kinase UbiB [Gammaproteobacteria bacterium]
MVNFGELFRLLTIQRILIRYGLDEIVFATHLFRPVRFLFYLLPWNWFRRRHGPRAERLRKALEDLGPTFVKLGQVLSTRRDLLPEDMADEFARLQDSVPPFPTEEARRIIEKSLDQPIAEVFDEFSETPLASASIAQVHSASLKDGRKVIVKVVRPGIERVIKRDLGLLYFLADKAERFSAVGRRLRPTNVVNELHKTIMGELDLMCEAANASQLRRNFAGSDKLYVPEVEWKYTSRNVMVMERISGIPVKDTRQLVAAGVDLKWLAAAGVEIFFTQVFRDSFFHADMHPGNIFVSRPKPGIPPRVLVVDFGIMSSLSEFDQRYLAENFIAFLNRDYQRVAELHVESGWVPAGTRVDEFEAAIRTVCEPLFDRTIQEISFGMLLLRLFQTARRFGMVIMPQLLLLQKTLVNIEGLGRQLDPELDIWKTARPLLDRWMSDRMGIRGLYKGTKENLPRWLDRLPELPNKTIDLIERLRDGRVQFAMRSEDIEELRKEIRASNQRTVMAIIGSTFVICAAIIYGLDGFSPVMIGGAPVLTWALGITGLGLLVFSTSD